MNRITHSVLPLQPITVLPFDWYGDDSNEEKDDSFVHGFNDLAPDFGDDSTLR